MSLFPIRVGHTLWGPKSQSEVMAVTYSSYPFERLARLIGIDTDDATLAMHAADEIERCRRVLGEKCPGASRPRRDFYWQWPRAGQTWLMWAHQNYGDDWISWRVGPLNYRVQIAAGGQTGGYMYYGKERGN